MLPPPGRAVTLAWCETAGVTEGEFALDCANAGVTTPAAATAATKASVETLVMVFSWLPGNRTPPVPREERTRRLEISSRLCERVLKRWNNPLPEQSCAPRHSAAPR